MTISKRLSVWTILWLAWLCAFLGIELPAALARAAGGTLSEHVWDWFSLRSRKRFWLVRRIIFGVFWLSLGIGHFMLGGPALWTVIVPGVPFAGVIVLSSLFERRDEEESVGWLKTLTGKVWSGLKGGTGWVLKRGPLWASLLTGAAIVVPGAAPILKTIAAAVAGASGGSIDQTTATTAGEVVAGLLLFIGALRKFWAIAKPQLS